MTKKDDPVNTIAPLHNVALFSELVQRVLNRTPGLPGMAAFYGPSGYGKTFAATYAANKHRAYHVQVKSVWTKKALCMAILDEMGIEPKGTIPEMVDKIGEELSLSTRPLIIDEADFLVAKKMIEVIRDIYESSFGTIILIGEEGLPHKLRPWERVHGRMLDWGAAQPGTLDDTKHLASRIYCPDIEIGADLLKALHGASGGSVRRICVNLDRVREAASMAGLKKIGLAEWKGQFFTGNPPARRAA